MNLKERYLSPTPRNVKVWLLVIKAAIGAAIAHSYVIDNPSLMFFFTIAGAVVNELAQLTVDTPKE